MIVVHESPVCPEQLNCLLFFRKILQLPQIIWFSAFLCIWTLSNNDCMILSSIFELQKENPCIKPGREYFLFWSGYIWLNLSYGKHASSFWRAAINEKNMIFRQNKKNIHIFMFKCFHALALNVWFFLLEHQWPFESSVIVANESLSCPRCEKMDLKIIQSLLERVQIHKNAVKQRICGTWRIFLKNSRQFNCSGQTGDSWTLSLNTETAVDHSGNNTVLRIKRM